MPTMNSRTSAQQKVADWTAQLVYLAACKEPQHYLSEERREHTGTLFAVGVGKRGIEITVYNEETGKYSKVVWRCSATIAQAILDRFKSVTQRTTQRTEGYTDSPTQASQEDIEAHTRPSAKRVAGVNLFRFCFRQIEGTEAINGDSGLYYSGPSPVA